MRFFEKAFKGFYQYYNFLLGSAVGKIFPLWITPNGISVFRAFLFLPVLILLLLDFQIPAFVLFVFAAYLDSVDGLLARSRQAMSELGAAVDALMDKMFFICLIVPTVFLMDYSTTTVFYPILVFSSLSLIVPVEVWLTIVRWQDYQQFAAKKSKKLLIKAGMSGKIKFLLEMCGLGAYILAYPDPESNFALLGSFFIILSAPFLPTGRSSPSLLPASENQGRFLLTNNQQLTHKEAFSGLQRFFFLDKIREPKNI